MSLKVLNINHKFLLEKKITLIFDYIIICTVKISTHNLWHFLVTSQHRIFKLSWHWKVYVGKLLLWNCEQHSDEVPESVNQNFTVEKIKFMKNVQLPPTSLDHISKVPFIIILPKPTYFKYFAFQYKTWKDKTLQITVKKKKRKIKWSFFKNFFFQM